MAAASRAPGAAGEASTTALVVIDVQVGQFPTCNEADFLDHVCKLIAKAHAAKMPVFFIQHNGRKGTELEPCTPGWQLHPSLDIQPGDRVITKDFIDSFYRTALLDELRARKVTRLVLCGLQTDFCVDTACRHAFSLDFKVVVARDAHSTQDSESLKAEQIIAHHARIWDGRFAELKLESEIEF